MPAVEAGPVHGVLPTHARVRDGARADAEARRAASGLSVCRRAHAAGPLAESGPYD